MKHENLREKCHLLAYELRTRSEYGRPLVHSIDEIEEFANDVLEMAAKIADRNDKSAWGIAEEIRTLKSSK